MRIGGKSFVVLSALFFLRLLQIDGHLIFTSVYSQNWVRSF